MDIFYSIKEVEKYIENNSNKKICLYIADKSKEAWDMSTSRVYMNQINEEYAYLPFNIQKGNNKLISEVYNFCEKCSQIVAINQTQPHKSNSVMKEKFSDFNIKNIDSLVKNDEGKLVPYNLNGVSFTSWFEDEISSFFDNEVVIFGCGGAGESIVRRISELKVKKIWIVDIDDKEELANELSRNIDIKYCKSLDDIILESSKFILVNCAGKEGADDSCLKDFFNKYESLGNIFIDLRPQLKIDIVEYARKKYWKAYTGFGMNSRNDYSLLELIKKYSNIEIPSFKEFEKLVRNAS